MDPTSDAAAWLCECGFRNRAANICCGGVNGKLGCKAPKPQSHTSTSLDTPGVVDAHLPRLLNCLSSGRWVCPACSFKNRPHNGVCGGGSHLGCGLLRPDSEVEKSPKVDTDWTCRQCETLNEGVVLTCVRKTCQAVRMFTGVVKSVGADYGFMSCAETQAIFSRDVYVSKKVLLAAFGKKEPTSGVACKFQVALNDCQQPNVSKVWIELSSEDAVGKHDFLGVLKYISEEKGYGFIECSETFAMFSSDVYAAFDRLQDVSLGQHVRFCIRLGKIGGSPQAIWVRPEAPAPEVLPAACKGSATEALREAWGGRVLLLGEGDLSFATAVAKLHKESQLDATVFLDPEAWFHRFSEHTQRACILQGAGHSVRFSVDATTESCAGYSMVFFNFPHISTSDVQAMGQKCSRTPSGDLATAFLDNAASTSDVGTLIVIGLWGRCDGGADSTLYGEDSHALISAALAKNYNNRFLESALEGGFVRDGVGCDYGFYDTFGEAGYCFRTTAASASFEGAHKEWHLQGCFVLRVAANS